MNNNTKLEVTGCLDCPFSVMYDMAPGYGCKAKRDKNGNSCAVKMGNTYMPITPSWCPLLKSSLTISIKQQ